ncbi:MAG: DUF1573 domain-containing protein [Candidatus Latescibacteria bacterium]|nr:DUF1573 domain-containing protein [Candidatus Latescibacterota bacterium]
MHSREFRLGKRVLMIALFFHTWSGLSAWAETREPDIQFETQTADFGRLLEGEKTEIHYFFRNAGTDTLTIENVRTSCGCTAALVSEKRVAPGEKGDIRVTFNSSGFLGKPHKTVSVWSNDPDTPKTTLSFSGIVWSEVTVTPRRIAFGQIEKAALDNPSPEERRREAVRLWREVRVEFPTNPKLFVTGAMASSPALKAEVMPRAAEDSGEDVVRIRITPEAPIGALAAKVTMFTTSKIKPTVSVGVRADVRGDLAATPRSLPIRVSRKDTSYVRQVFVWKKGKENLRIEAVEDHTGSFTAEVVELKPGQKYRIDLRLRPDAKAGSVKGKVIIRTNYPEDPFVEISVVGRIEE